MPSPYSILEPVCAYTGADIHSNLPPKHPSQRNTFCRRVPSQSELSSANRIFVSTTIIFIILLLPWLLLGVKFLEHPHRFWIMALGTALHLNTCLFVYTEGVAMGMMYVRSVGCSPVQVWEKKEAKAAEEEERYRDDDDDDDGEECLDIEKIAEEKDEARGRVRPRTPLSGTERGTMHGQFGP